MNDAEQMAFCGRLAADLETFLYEVRHYAREEPAINEVKAMLERYAVDLYGG